MYSSTNPENLDPDEELENECEFCGEACESHFCSKECRRSYNDDNDDNDDNC